MVGGAAEGVSRPRGCTETRENRFGGRVRKRVRNQPMLTLRLAATKVAANYATRCSGWRATVPLAMERWSANAASMRAANLRAIA